MIRKYSFRKDKKAIHRIWQECGWIGREKQELEALDRFVGVSDCWVAELDGNAESMATSTPGTFFHSGTPLQLAAITSVTTSRVARNQQTASRTVARLVSEQAFRGAQLSGLGIFEQGFYDRLGYGNGAYEHMVRFDPAWLVRLGTPRVPVRLGRDDWKEIHEARFSRRKLHGAVDLTPPEISLCEMDWSKNVFGLGYRENGKLTHFFVAHADEVETGPYRIDWMVYRSVYEFRELLALVRGLGDQVRQGRMREPRDVQLQSLMKKPFQLHTITQEGKFTSRVAAYAYWQMRILDLPSCVSAVHARASLRFNLRLQDPLSRFVDDDAPWRGCGGDYVVELGEESTAHPGSDPELPELKATVGDFTRFWMGGTRADVLAGLHSFRAPADLIQALDAALVLPKPAPDWDF